MIEYEITTRNIKKEVIWEWLKKSCLGEKRFYRVPLRGVTQKSRFLRNRFYRVSPTQFIRYLKSFIKRILISINHYVHDFLYEFFRSLELLDKPRLKFLFLSLYLKIILHYLINDIVNNLLIFQSLYKKIFKYIYITIFHSFL